MKYEFRSQKGSCWHEEVVGAYGRRSTRDRRISNLHQSALGLSAFSTLSKIATIWLILHYPYLRRKTDFCHLQSHVHSLFFDNFFSRWSAPLTFNRARAAPTDWFLFRRRRVRARRRSRRLLTVFDLLAALLLSFLLKSCAILALRNRVAASDSVRDFGACIDGNQFARILTGIVWDN